MLISSLHNKLTFLHIFRPSLCFNWKWMLSCWSIMLQVSFKITFLRVSNIAYIYIYITQTTVHDKSMIKIQRQLLNFVISLHRISSAYTSAVTITTTFSKELDKTADLSDRNNWVGIVTILGVVILICIPIGISCIIIRKTKCKFEIFLK